MATQLFEVSKVEWNLQPSREITSSRTPPQLIRTGMSAMSVQCKSCGALWHSVAGHQPGAFRQFIGGVNLSCPKCGIEGQISQDSLNQLWA